MSDPVDIYRGFVREEQEAADAARTEGSALSVYQDFLRRRRAGDVEHLGEVVDLDGYTETCLGLTPWTTGFEVAWRNYQRNMVAPFSDMVSSVEEVVEGQHTVVFRSHAEATHSGEFLGIPATGRRIAWDAITIVHVQDGRFVGQWAQPNLYGIYVQLTAPDAPPYTPLTAFSAPLTPSKGQPTQHAQRLMWHSAQWEVT